MLAAKKLQLLNQSITDDFPILKQKVNGKRLVYLDNSATTQKPKQVINAIVDFYQNDNANVHRGVYQLSQRSTAAYENAHKIVAKFIGASFEEIIFTKGTTESINLLAYSLGSSLEDGDEIVLSQMEHHSNIVPWQQITEEKNLVLNFIPITEDYKLDIDEAKKLITQKTKIVSIAHMSNVLGTINPIKEIAQLAHSVGALMIVDAAQSAPHMKIDVNELDCDFLAFSGHKVAGPTGIGVLYGKKRLLERMKPFLYGGDMISEVTFKNSTWNELPWKFEAGTPNIAGAIGLAKAIEYLQSIGMDNIQEHGSFLAAYAIEKLSKIDGLQIIGPKGIENRGPVVSFVVEGIHPHDLSEILDRFGVAVRGGHHCAMPLMSLLGVNGTTRASFYIYNTPEDVDALAEGIMKAKDIFK